MEPINGIEVVPFLWLPELPYQRPRDAPERRVARAHLADVSEIERHHHNAADICNGEGCVFGEEPRRGRGRGGAVDHVEKIVEMLRHTRAA